MQLTIISRHLKIVNMSDETVLNVVTLTSSQGVEFVGNLTNLDIHLGYSVAGLNDVNGDGYDDVGIASYQSSSGIPTAYVVYGSDKDFPMPFDLTTMTASQGLTLTSSYFETISSGFYMTIAAAGGRICSVSHNY